MEAFVFSWPPSDIRLQPSSSFSEPRQCCAQLATRALAVRQASSTSGRFSSRFLAGPKPSVVFKDRKSLPQRVLTDSVQRIFAHQENGHVANVEVAPSSKPQEDDTSLPPPWRLWKAQKEAGAVSPETEFVKHESSWIPAYSYGKQKDLEGLRAAKHGVAVVDRSCWARIKVSDADRLSFLHNLSTNDFNKLKGGMGVDTTFVNAQARTLDVATALVTDESVIVLASPNRRKALMSHLDKFIFFQDKVQLADLTDMTAAFTVVGPASPGLLARLGVDTGDMCGLKGAHKFFRRSNDGVPMDVMLARTSGLDLEGYTLIVNADAAADLWKALVGSGGRPLGAKGWEILRIEQGRPTTDAELTEEYNALEAGLWHTVSFEKGCYIGQETIARLNTYKGVKTQIWGLKIEPAPDGSVPAAGTPLLGPDGDKVGVMTSVMQKNQRLCIGMGYVRTKVGEEGMRLAVGDSGCSAVLSRLSYVKHQEGEPPARPDVPSKTA